MSVPYENNPYNLDVEDRNQAGTLRIRIQLPRFPRKLSNVPSYLVAAAGCFEDVEDEFPDEPTNDEILQT
jgi:hypothetical protein